MTINVEILEAFSLKLSLKKIKIKSMKIMPQVAKDMSGQEHFSKCTKNT
jgi:hypothetical protein